MKDAKGYGYERIVGKTISGGAYSEIFYFSGYNEACEKKDATHCVIYERKGSGALVNKIYCKL